MAFGSISILEIERVLIFPISPDSQGHLEIQKKNFQVSCDTLGMRQLQYLQRSMILIGKHLKLLNRNSFERRADPSWHRSRDYCFQSARSVGIWGVFDGTQIAAMPRTNRLPPSRSNWTIVTVWVHTPLVVLNSLDTNCPSERHSL